MVDDFRERGGSPVFVDGLLGQLPALLQSPQRPALREAARASLLTAAAVIHIVFTEQRRSARDGERQLAKGWSRKAIAVTSSSII
jgi:hypothetical protein